MSSQLITSKDANNICKCFVKTDVVKLTVCLVKHNCSKGILIILLSQWVQNLKYLTEALKTVGENNACIPPTLEGWVYITPIHGPRDGPLYTWAQYTPTPPAV